MNAHGVGARKHRVAVLVFEALDKHIDFVAALDGEIALPVEELFARDHAFGFVPDVDQNVLFGDAYDHAPDDLALLLRYSRFLLVILKQRAEVLPARLLCR